MKRFNHVALLTSFVIMMCVHTEMSAQKVAFVSSETILEKLPDAKTVRGKLSELQSSWMREIQKMEADIVKLKAEHERNRLLWSAQEKKEAESALSDLQAKLSTYRNSKFGPGGEYEKQYSEQMNPILDKVFKAIQEEAKAGRFDGVFDKSSRAQLVLYFNPANDITALVLKRLGVALDSAEAAGLSGKGTDSGSSGVSPDPSKRGIPDRSSPTTIDPGKAMKPPDK